MSVTWEIYAEVNDKRVSAIHYVTAYSHEKMIDALREKGFKRMLKDSVPYQVPPRICMEPAEILSYECGEITIFAEWHEPPIAYSVDRVPNCKEMVEHFKKNNKK